MLIDNMAPNGKSPNRRRLLSKSPSPSRSPQARMTKKDWNNMERFVHAATFWTTQPRSPASRGPSSARTLPMPPKNLLTGSPLRQHRPLPPLPPLPPAELFLAKKNNKKRNELPIVWFI